MILSDDILLQVRKPGRYLGNEWNSVHKDFTRQDIRFAICFPDLYEVGMSHLGLRIIYGLLNNQEGVVCERVFLPDLDMQEILKSRNIPLFSLESQVPLGEFDFIGFCLNYELNYTNCLAVLDLAGIPLKASDRDESFPLIIGGGICAGNPEPLADFMDLFFIGEAENALLEIVNAYKVARGAKSSKENILKELAKVEGVYLPSFYEVKYDAMGAVVKFEPKYSDLKVKIKKRMISDLNQAYYPVSWLVPHVQIVHDRAALELMRGCPHNCNFCQASNFYRHLRVRSPQKVLELAGEIYKSSGYEEISLLSLSTSDYPGLAGLINSLSCKFEGSAVALSLPSLRPKSYLGDLAQYLGKVRKTTITLAPEAGSQRMREIINKNFNIDEFYAAILSVYQQGWKGVKLYFMIGLPQEEYSDLDEILEVAKKVSMLRKQVSNYNGEINVSISNFVPKPHTFFSREKMDSAQVLREKKLYLMKKSKGIRLPIKLSFHNSETSYLEGVFTRGTRQLGEVLLTAYKNGCLLDSWPEHFKFSMWLKAFSDCGVSPDSYLRERKEDERLPWEHIDLSY